MEATQELSAKVHQKAVEQAIGEFRTYFKTLDQDTKKILKNQSDGPQTLRPVDVELRDKLRLDYLIKKFGERGSFSAYTFQEKTEMYRYFCSLEKSFRRCYEAGLVQWNGWGIDGSLNGTAKKITG